MFDNEVVCKLLFVVDADCSHWDDKTCEAIKVE